ncbi:uncharacterized protein LOC103696367 [Phoenix dactylifera]|uniref:Uncharacterized protein LOC103696367 n=1 Tax=Phoenix dactylifera TaxID=42345 RepID=A0A8B7BGF1_PHODC|nr:uncharacterized protein LOC103696367 [Phoenix dactylifera]
MAMTQFAMVEELASLIKDNLYSKHLVLSTEEALVNFLQDDTSPDGVLELQPTSPYNRLLLHRLADIYGFAHESVGEGEDRHLVLERCPDTAIPSILVSDILWQYDEYQSPASSHHILKRKETPASKLMQISLPSTPLEEREAAYQAARERIFSLNDCDEKDVLAPRSRKVPMVARRMIAHALGQKICSTPSNQKTSAQEFEENESTEGPTNDEGNEDQLDSTLEYSKEATAFPNSKLGTSGRKIYDKPATKSGNYNSITSIEMKGHDKAVSSGSTNRNSVANTSNGRVADIGNLEKEQIGAAKRIFAHALGIPSSKGNNSLTVKSKANGPFRRDI